MVHILHGPSLRIRNFDEGSLFASLRVCRWGYISLAHQTQANTPTHADIWRFIRTLSAAFTADLKQELRVLRVIRVLRVQLKLTVMNEFHIY